MAYRNEGFQRAIYFVYISDGKCLKNWKDDDSGALIDILALGTGEEESLSLVDRILEEHEVHTVILPGIEGEREISRRFSAKGVAEILSGNGVLLRDDWKFCYWSDQGYLSVFHDIIPHSQAGDIVMGERPFRDLSECTPYLEQGGRCCGVDCLQCNDCDALNGENSFEDGVCTGTLILGKGACTDSGRYVDFVRVHKNQIRVILLAFDGKDFSRVSEILEIKDEPLYCYYLGGYGDAGLAAEVALSGPYARYQSLENGYGVCISGCFIDEDL
ncbi:MAG: hypothetical protein Q4D16_26135 [Eubacteriales bacterium]|nr:hypothetical protein [Eubacteriales bacterium]